MSTCRPDTTHQDDQWVIQRCTQRLVGFELEYEDFHTPEAPMTRDVMVRVLERVCREHLKEEFRGTGSVANCHPVEAGSGSAQNGRRLKFRGFR
jgi:hypothetical protein